MTLRNASKTTKPITAEAIARLADQVNDIWRFFEGKGRLVHPIQRVNVDLTASKRDEIDQAAQNLNISRQAVIKALVRQALDQHYLAQQAKRPPGKFYPRDRVRD
jgi:hypothetical protein